MVDAAGLTEAFDIESAGTIGFHVGSRPDSRMQKATPSHPTEDIGHEGSQTFSRLHGANHSSVKGAVFVFFHCGSCLIQV